MNYGKFVTKTACALALIAAPNLATAQSGNFGLELNNATDIENGCRLTYVATNNTGIALEKTSYEVAVFDDKGVVTRILVLEFGALPLQKTKVVQFDLGEQSCTTISRIVVNNVAACSSKEGNHDFCLDGLITNSRAEIQFGI